jgi:hypothetical protein
VLLLALAGLWIGGCTMPPVQQFEGFARGFEEVRSTTYVLIDDFELAKKTVRASTDEASKPPPEIFDIAEIRKHGVDSASARRRRAIDAVVRYNEAMLALANGHSIEAAKTFLAPISQLLKAAAPQFGFAESLVEGLIGRALQARDNAEFVRAFQDVAVATRADSACTGAQTDAQQTDSDVTCMPIIEGILEILARDTAEYYAVQIGRYTKLQSRLADEFFKAGRAVIDLAAGVKGPPAGSAAAQAVQEIVAEMTAVGRLITPQSGDVRLSFAAAGGSFKDSTLAAMQALMIPVRVLGEKADANRIALIDYHSALTDYVALIDQTVMLLREVQVAASRPLDVIAGIERLAVIRTDLESNAISTRSALLRAIAALQ